LAKDRTEEEFGSYGIRIKKVILAKGCPPSFEGVTKAFEKCGIHINNEAYQKFQHTLISRYQGKEEFEECFFYLR